MRRSALPREVAQIIRASLKSADAATLLRQKVSRTGNILKAGRYRHRLTKDRRIFVVGAGKATAAMAQAIERILGGRITEGLIVVKYGHAEPLSRIRVVEAAHPVPDRSGMQAARAITSLLRKAGADDLVIVLLSGGASALMPLPVPGITLAQKKSTTQLLLRCGAPIEEINIIRKHLSQIKGGHLATLAAPARVLTLILSDVPGNRVDTIASGPTAPDPSTYSDAVRVLKKYRIWLAVPATVRRHLQAGQKGKVPETPKPSQSEMKGVQHLLIGDYRIALRAAAQKARDLRMHTCVLDGFLQGEARMLARVFGSFARQLNQADGRSVQPVCVLASGETTVTVRGKGRGGRCQEFALAAVPDLSGRPRSVIAAFGTDGTDGPTSAAGAYVDGKTEQKARARGLSPRQMLDRNDSASFFEALGQQIVTGPTRTHVNDLYLAILR